MASQEQSMLLLTFGKTKYKLCIPTDTSLNDLQQIATQKCGTSQPVALEYFDSDFDEWVMVDEGYKLPVKGKLRVCLTQNDITKTPTEVPQSESGTKTSPKKPQPATVEKTDTSSSQPKPAVSAQVLNEEEGGQKKVEYSICTNAPEIKLSGVSSGQGGGAAASVSRDKIWKERKVLNVYFMNPDLIDDWKCRGEPMNVNTVIAWARVWNFVEYPEIPYFGVAERKEKADIRVQFTEKGGNWSMVGMDAALKGSDEPTMQLNLRGHQPELQESLVIHEFGHALGLEHEHQRSDFWRVLEPYIDIEKMKIDPRVNPAQSEDGKAAFGQNWFKQEQAEKSVNDLSEYDPDSIMHYWFDLAWIDENFRKCEDIDRTLVDKPEDAKYLRGLVKRSSMGYQLSKRPTIRDYRVLVKAYGGQYKEALDDKLQRNLVGPIEQPDPKDADKKVLRVNTHLRHIRNAVWDARPSWRDLGLELDISVGTLESIDSDRRNAGDKLGAILEKWMYSGRAKIEQLLAALESKTVGKGSIAQDLLMHRGDPDGGAKYGF